MDKIEKELKEFKEFKKSYVFNQKDIEEKEGILYCEGIALINKEGKELGESEKWINVRFQTKRTICKGAIKLISI